MATGYFKCKKILKDVWDTENLKQKLEDLFKVEFRMDNAGRIYTVLNPNLLIKGPDGSFSTQIFEYGVGGVSDQSEWLNHWAANKFSEIENFLIETQLLEVVSFHFEKIDDYGNYLFILEPTGFQKTLKVMKWILGVVGGIAVALTIILPIVL